MALLSKYFLNKNHQDFVYFSPNTLGIHGRAVKIYKNLFLPFYCIVDPATHEGQLIVRQIEALKTVPSLSTPSPRGGQGARHVQQLANIKDAFEHMLASKSVQVYYRISQEESDKMPTVYITEVRKVLRGSNEKAGLYQSSLDARGRTEVSRLKHRTVDGRTIFINGNGENVADGLKAAMNESGKKNSLLFYCPSSVTNDLGIWSASIRSRSTQESVDELTQILRENQNPKQEISWIVEGSGAALLSKSVKELGGNLEKHSFKFINTQANTPELIQNLSQKKATFKGEFFNYSRNPTALIAMASHSESLKKQISELPGNQGYDKITRRYLLEQVEALTQIGATVVHQSQQLNQTYPQTHVNPKTKNNPNIQFKPRFTFMDALQKAGAHRK